MPICARFQLNGLRLDSRYHDDDIKWKHFPHYCPFVRETTDHWWIPRTKNSDAELFICAWTNSWAENRYAGDFRRHCTHYDFTVMISTTKCCRILKFCTIFITRLQDPFKSARNSSWVGMKISCQDESHVISVKFDLKYNDRIPNAKDITAK